MLAGFSARMLETLLESTEHCEEFNQEPFADSAGVDFTDRLIC